MHSSPCAPYEVDTSTTKPPLGFAHQQALSPITNIKHANSRTRAPISKRPQAGLPRPSSTDAAGAISRNATAGMSMILSMSTRSRLTWGLWIINLLGSIDTESLLPLPRDARHLGTMSTLTAIVKQIPMLISRILLSGIALSLIPIDTLPHATLTRQAPKCAARCPARSGSIGLPTDQDCKSKSRRMNGTCSMPHPDHHLKPSLGQLLSRGCAR